MTSKVWSSGTVIDSAWLNDVDARVYGAKSAVVAVANIATLKTLDKTLNTRAFVQGYYVAGDGGGGSYYYDSTDTTSSDNGGNIIVASDSGRWKLASAGRVTVKHFGAKGDGTTDDTSAIQAYINAFTGKISAYFPAGDYRLTNTITFADKHTNIQGEGEEVTRLFIEHTNAGISFTDSYNGTDNFTVRRFSIDGLTLEKTVNTSSLAGGTGIFCSWAYTGAASIVNHARFSNLAILGNSAGTRYFNIGINIRDGGQVTMDAVQIYNLTNNSPLSRAAILIDRVNAANSTTFKLDKLFLHNYASAVEIDQSAGPNGTVEGIYVTNSEFVSCRFGFLDSNTNASKIINVIHFANGHMNMSKSAARIGVISNFRVANCEFNLDNWGENGAAGGGVSYFDFFNTGGLINLQIYGNRGWRNAGTTTTGAFCNVPYNATGVRIQGNIVEGFSTLLSVSGGTPARNETTGILQDNTLVGTGIANPFGILSEYTVSGTTGAIATGTVVNFGHTLPSIPRVVAMHSGTATAINVVADTVTTTGFTVYHNFGGNCSITWIASCPSVSS